MEGWVSNLNTFQITANNVGSMGSVRFRKYLIIEIRSKSGNASILTSVVSFVTNNTCYIFMMKLRSIVNLLKMICTLKQASSVRVRKNVQFFDALRLSLE